MHPGTRGEGRVWSWAASAVEVDARRQDAHELVGQRLDAVRYYTLDYNREALHPELIDRGPRLIDTQDEWNEPTWRCAGFDAIDYGLEIETDSGGVLSLTGDPPGDPERIGTQRVQMLGSGVARRADVAIWSVVNETTGRAPMRGVPGWLSTAP